MSIALISLIVAICSALATLANWFYTFSKNRKNYRVQVLEIGNDLGIYVLTVSFENLSRLPLSITRFSLILNEEIFDCDFLPAVITETSKWSGGKVIDKTKHYSLPFPVNLGSYSAQSGHVRFQIPLGYKQLISNTLPVRVCTNRGKIDEIELSLPEVLPLSELF